MSHTTKITDMDPLFVIDPITRAITKESGSKTTVIQYDHNSEKFTFSLPRIVEGHDMTECNRVEVHYLTTSGNTGVYEVTDLSVYPEDESLVVCTWLLSQNATADTGVLSFLVRFSCVAEDGTILYAWNTGIYAGISVQRGLYNAEDIDEQYADILEQWYIRLFSLSDEGVSNINTAKANALSDIITAKNTALNDIEVKGNSVNDSIPKDYTDLSQKVNETYSNIFRQPNNLYKGEIREGGYYDRGVWTESSAYKEAILPLDAVKNGDILTFPEEYAYYKTSYLVNVISADGTFIKATNVSSYQPIQILGINADSFYVTMRLRASLDESKLVIVNDGILDAMPYSEYEELQRKKLHPIRNKVINCLGDSFTSAGTSWVYQLASRLNITCNNYGLGSSRISVDSGDVLSFLNRYSTMDTSADITIIFGGINDAASIKTGNITLGSMESSLDNTTFYGALRLLIESIKAHMPGKKIIGVIPPDFAQNANYQNTLPQVQQACREVYEYYSIPYADLKKDCQEMYQDEYNIATYRESATDFHPNRAGHLAISEVIQGVLEKYIKC